MVDGVFLKLCFQVFIVLFPADEAGACRVHEGAWVGCGIDDSIGWCSPILAYGPSRRSLSFAGVVLEPLCRWGEIDHSSHCIHVRFPVIGIRSGLASEQTRKFVFAFPHAQDLSLLTPPDAVNDEVLL